MNMHAFLRAQQLGTDDVSKAKGFQVQSQKIQSQIHACQDRHDLTDKVTRDVEEKAAKKKGVRWTKAGAIGQYIGIGVAIILALIAILVGVNRHVRNWLTDALGGEEVTNTSSINSGTGDEKDDKSSSAPTQLPSGRQSVNDRTPPK